MADSTHGTRPSRPPGAWAAGAGASAAADAAPRPDASAGPGSAAPASPTDAGLGAAVLTHGEGERTQVLERDRPLRAYALLSGAFITAFGVPLVLAERRGALPERIPAQDVGLVAAGTFKLSRLLSRDAVTGFVRAPFVEFEGMEGVTDPRESPRGTGLRRAVGQLLLCPGCVGLWAAASLTAALVAAPRSTRVACSTLGALAAADFLQVAYARLSATRD